MRSDIEVTHGVTPDPRGVLSVKVQMLLGGAALSTLRSWERPPTPLTLSSYSLGLITWGLLQGGHAPQLCVRYRKSLQGTPSLF